MWIKCGKRRRKIWQNLPQKTVGPIHWANVFIIPHFPAIGQPNAGILRFNGFQMMAVRYLGFFKFEKVLTELIRPISVSVRRVNVCKIIWRSLSVCKIWLKLVQ